MKLDISGVLASYDAFLRSRGATSDDPDERTVNVGAYASFTRISNPLRVLRAGLRGNLGMLSDKEIVELYDAQGPEMLMALTPIYAKLMQLSAILQVVEGEAYESMCDFGSGSGFLPLFLKSRGVVPWAMSAVDGSEMLVNAGLKLAAQLGVEIDFRRVLLGQEPTTFADDSIDLVICVDLIDCSQNWRTIIREMARTARKRIIIIYTMSSMFRRIDPIEVVAELSKWAVVDVPWQIRLYRDSEAKSGVVVSASKGADSHKGGILVGKVAN